MRRRVGVFSGTFDPVHSGHIEFALAAKAQCDLDEVIFLPEREPRGKLFVGDFAHRSKMLELATGEHKALSTFMLDHKRFTTADTLPALRSLLPGADLILLIGSDTAQTFSYRWPGLRQLLQEMELAVGLRGDQTEQNIKNILCNLGWPVRFKVVAVPEYSHASATNARKGNYDLVPQIVRDYIKANHLYK